MVKQPCLFGVRLTGGLGSKRPRSFVERNHFPFFGSIATNNNVQDIFLIPGHNFVSQAKNGLTNFNKLLPLIRSAILRDMREAGDVIRSFVLVDSQYFELVSDGPKYGPYNACSIPFVEFRFFVEPEVNPWNNAKHNRCYGLYCIRIIGIELFKPIHRSFLEWLMPNVPNEGRKPPSGAPLAMRLARFGA